MRNIILAVFGVAILVGGFLLILEATGLVVIESPEGIKNVFIVLLGIIAVIGVARAGRWLYDEKLNPVTRTHACLVDKRTEAVQGRDVDGSQGIAAETLAYHGLKKAAQSLKGKRSETLFAINFMTFELESGTRIELIPLSRERVIPLSRADKMNPFVQSLEIGTRGLLVYRGRFILDFIPEGGEGEPANLSKDA